MRPLSLCQLIIIGFLALGQGCVQSYDPHLVLDANLVVVNGIITDLPEKQTVSLSRSRSSADSANVSTPIAKATVQMLVNGTAVPLVEDALMPGVYALPAGFRGRVGDTYQLQFKTAAGAEYQSTVETMTAAPPILKAYDRFNPDGPKRTANALPTPVNDIYVDYQDPADSRNFYLWRWRLYEQQRWCASCQQGHYVVNDIGPVGSGPINVIGCVQDLKLGIYNVYDYQCRSLCWDIFYSSAVNVFADIYTNGQKQIGYKVASIPIYQLDDALVSIEQLSLSANAYRYYKLFADQTQNTGTLADSPPAPISGNVKNVTNSQENVVGYFSAASVAVNNYKIIRTNAPVSAGQFQGLFYYQNNRQPNVEVISGVYGQGVPSAVCVPGRTRTDLLPPGWNQ